MSKRCTEPARNDWVVVDFETASTRGTPCQVAAARYHDGGQSAVYSTLIFQPPQSFDSFNIALHGITPDAVRHAPGWPDVCSQLMAFADGAPFVAHYAPFDMGAIRDASDANAMPWPTLRYTCTVSISRVVWPGLSSYSLLLLCSDLGLFIDHDQHHRATYDVQLAATILNRAITEQGATGLADLLERTHIRFGEIAPGNWFGSYLRPLAATPPPANPEADPQSPLYGETVVFTGELAMVRRQAWHLVADMGGIPEANVTKRTTMLVCGYQDIYKLAGGQTESSKLRRAKELRSEGRPIEILGERDFFRLLHASDDSALLAV